jgi:hypothetical protein
VNGTLGILNVGAGDTKLTFDKNNPAERIRAARIVKDMLRRGYALLIEVDDGQGGRTHQRATDFDENTCEYIIADFDPVAAKDTNTGIDDGPANSIIKPQATPAVATPPEPIRRKAGRPRRVAAEGARGVAVARTAGG